MSKFKEKDLNDILKEFENKSNVEIEFENDLIGCLVLNNITIKYDEKLGFINIEGINTKLKINTTLVNRYEKNDDKIIIILDTLTLSLKKCNGECR